MDSEDYSLEIKCFLCNQVFTDTEEPWYIFHKQLRSEDSVEFSIAAKLSEILEHDVLEETAHSSFLCEICNSNLLEYESIERRLHLLRKNIQRNYNSTLALKEADAINCNDELVSLQFSDIIEECSVTSDHELDTTPSPLTIKMEENIKQEPNNDVENLVEYVTLNETKSNNNEQEEENSYSENWQINDNVYRCTLCDFAGCGNLQLMMQHFRDKHGKNIFCCELCTAIFTCSTDLNAHKQLPCSSVGCSKKDLASFICDPCQLSFRSYRDFCQHRRINHENGTTVNKYACNECEKQFSSQNRLDAHMNTHCGAHRYKCHQCSKDFSSKYTLQVHSKIHTERTRCHPCSKCDKTFYNKQSLIHHKKLHVGIKAFKCDECDKSFKVQSSLDVHKKIHTGWRPFKCHTCGKGFARRSEVRDHERTHTGEKPFQCDQCPLAFAQRSNLTSHKKYTHLKEALHKCAECDRSFKRRRLLDYHVQSVHTGERPHKCTVCGMGFVYPEHFKKHMRKHTGHKPYACEVCFKRFKSSDNRNTHRFVHSDKKPYECLQCGAGFMRKPLLLMHMANTGHTTDTIIVNHPQIKTDNDELQEENLSSSNGNGFASLMTMNSLTDEDVSIKYLQFYNTDNHGPNKFTWKSGHTSEVH